MADISASDGECICVEQLMLHYRQVSIEQKEVVAAEPLYITDDRWFLHNSDRQDMIDLNLKSMWFS